MRAFLAIVALSLVGCANLTKDIRADVSSISHKTTVTTLPPAVSSEWTFIMRPLPAVSPVSPK